MIEHRSKRHGGKVAIRLIMMASLIQLAGCGDGNPAKGTAPVISGGSCNHHATGNCMEWTGAAWKGMTMQKLCESQKGTFVPGACPAEGRVGTCLKAKGSKDESRFGYYTGFPGYGIKLTPEAVAAQGAEQCAKNMKGEWLARQ